MRHLIVPTCLFVSAWAHPAGPILEFIPVATENVSIVEKTRVAAAETATATAGLTRDDSTPAETTGELTAFVDDGGTANPEIDSLQLPDDVAALEFPMAGVELVPLPPHRAIPHRLVCEALADAAVDNDLPTPFLIRLIWQESGFNQNAVSPVGAQGVAQFMPETAAQRGLDDPFNPLHAVRASAQLLRDLFNQFGNLGLAAAAYNAGPKRVQDWLAKRGKLPQETRDYVQRITGVAPEHWKTQPTAAAIRVPAQVPCQREAGLLAANGPPAIPLPPTAPTAAPAREPVKIAEKTQAKVHVADAKHARADDAKAAAGKPATTKIATTKPEKSATTKTVKTLAAKRHAKPGKGKAKKIEVASAHK